MSTSKPSEHRAAILGDDQKIRALFRASLADDSLDLQTRLEDGHIRFGYPVAVLVGDR